MKIIIAVALGVLSVVSTAASAETLTATFTTADGGVTTGLYSGTVAITVSGVGQSEATAFNDAFYLLGPPPAHDSQYYQLTFGTSTLIPFSPASDAVNYIVGGLPVFSATNTYTFLLNTGLATPGQLHFGVSDGNFSDNSGAFTINISAVPEPASWAMMLGGFGLVGTVLRRRRTIAVSFG